MAETIKQQVALACLQINHEGRFAGVPEAVAPSAVETFGRMFRARTLSEIAEIQDKHVDAASRVKKAGYDLREQSIMEINLRIV